LYDWLCDFELLLPTWKELVRPEQKVLIVGCGNSQLAEKLYSVSRCGACGGSSKGFVLATQEGYTRLTCMDFSPRVIETMRARWRDFLTARCVPIESSGVTWDVEDLRAMRYATASFDVVFDKATLDALLTRGDNEEAGVPRALSEIARVLAPVCTRSSGKEEGEGREEVAKHGPWLILMKRLWPFIPRCTFVVVYACLCTRAHEIPAPTGWPLHLDLMGREQATIAAPGNQWSPMGRYTRGNAVAGPRHARLRRLRLSQALVHGPGTKQIPIVTGAARERSIIPCNSAAVASGSEGRARSVRAKRPLTRRNDKRAQQRASK